MPRRAVLVPFCCVFLLLAATASARAGLSDDDPESVVDAVRNAASRTGGRPVPPALAASFDDPAAARSILGASAARETPGLRPAERGAGTAARLATLARDARGTPEAAGLHRLAGDARRRDERQGKRQEGKRQENGGPRADGTAPAPAEARAGDSAPPRITGTVTPYERARRDQAERQAAEAAALRERASGSANPALEGFRSDLARADRAVATRAGDVRQRLADRRTQEAAMRQNRAQIQMRHSGAASYSGNWRAGVRGTTPMSLPVAKPGGPSWRRR
jgi:hypothetical protein